MNRHLSRRTFIASAAASMIPSAMAHSQPGNGGLFSLFKDDPEAASIAEPKWQDAGVIDLSRSPFAKLKTVPVRAVVLQEGFWSQRRKTNLSSSIPSMHDELVAHGRMDNFLRLEGSLRSRRKDRSTLTRIFINGPRQLVSLCKQPTSRSSAIRLRR